jgi:hypothetical protein
MEEPKQNLFEAAGGGKEFSLPDEFTPCSAPTKKGRLLPIALIIRGATGAAPFIYTLL